MEEMTFEEFSREVNNIYKKNCEVYYKLASHFGMTETMFDILYFVRENDGGYTQAQLCESLHLRKQTVNSALKKPVNRSALISTKRSCSFLCSKS